MATKAHLEGNKRYLETQDEIRLRMPKESGKKKLIQSAAQANDESVNQFILTAVDERMERLQAHTSHKNAV